MKTSKAIYPIQNAQTQAAIFIIALSTKRLGKPFPRKAPYSKAWAETVNEIADEDFVINP